MSQNSEHTLTLLRNSDGTFTALVEGRPIKGLLATQTNTDRETGFLVATFALADVNFLTARADKPH